MPVVGLILFYFIGVVVRQHSGIRVVIQNESGEPVEKLSVGVEHSDYRHDLENLMPGDLEQVFVKTGEQSRVVVEFVEAGHGPRTITVFDHAEAGDCGTSTVKFLPRRDTESVETHQTVCWNGLLDFL